MYTRQYDIKEYDDGQLRNNINPFQLVNKQFGIKSTCESHGHHELLGRGKKFHSKAQHAPISVAHFGRNQGFGCIAKSDKLISRFPARAEADSLQPCDVLWPVTVTLQGYISTNIERQIHQQESNLETLSVHRN